jgi:hypothetical protein
LRRLLWILSLWLAIFATATFARAQEADTNAPAVSHPRHRVCAVCGQEFYIPWGYPTNVDYVCANCNRIETHCAVCGLPAPLESSLRTEDGRLICKRCVPKVVLTQEEAEQIFQNVVSELDTLFKGALSLKFSNVVLKVYATDYWNEEAGRRNSGQERRVGFTISRAAGDQLTHNISLVTGTKKREMAAVCAHEYTHCWINENRPKEHEIELDTIESLCELTAYNLMKSHQDQELMDSIKANLYTRGKILTAIDCQNRVGFPAILQWVKTGKEANLDNLNPQETPPPAPVYITRPIASPVYDALVLNGIVGTGKKRMAMINGRPFAPSDEASLQVGNATVLVQCLEINKNSVVVKVDGGKTITLGSSAK